MTKDELRQYRGIQIEICQIERKIKALEGRTDDIGVTDALRNLYHEKLKALLECQIKIEKVIESLDPTERTLMRMRYIDGAEWIEVAEAIHYEWTQTHRIHAKALAKIKDL